MSATAETPKSLAKFESEAFALAQAGVVKIVDQNTYNLAVERLAYGKNWIDGFLGWINKEWVGPTYNAWKHATKNRTDIVGPAEKIVNAQKAEVVRWDQEQQRKQRELERQAREKAEREAEGIRLQKAQEAEAAGMDAESVDAILDEPVYVAPADVAPTYDKSAEIQMRDHWVGEIEESSNSFALYATWAVKNKRFGLLRPDPTAMGALAREVKDSQKIPGLRIQNKPVVATGRR